MIKIPFDLFKKMERDYSNLFDYSIFDCKTPKDQVEDLHIEFLQVFKNQDIEIFLNEETKKSIHDSILHSLFDDSELPQLPFSDACTVLEDLEILEIIPKKQ
jgi:hypothetical protein